MMDNDDLPVSRILSRREALKLLAGVSVASLVGCRAVAATTQTVNAAATISASTADNATAIPVSGSASTVSTCVVRPK